MGKDSWNHADRDVHEENSIEVVKVATNATE
jgi:hypothetical protein